MISQPIATEDSCYVAFIESAGISLLNGERARAGVIMRIGHIVIQTGSRKA
jgi:hypothetical protein